MNTQFLNHGFWLMLALFSLAHPVHAADEAMARAQFMIRQISAERDQLQADKAGLQKQLDELQKNHDALESKSSKSSGDMKQQFVELRDLYEAERKKNQETGNALSGVVTEKNRLADMVSKQQENIGRCIANNHKLHDITQKLLTNYADKSMWDSLVQTEPFTGFSKVEIENLVDDIQYGLDDLRVNADLMTTETVN